MLQQIRGRFSGRFRSDDRVKRRLAVSVALKKASERLYTLFLPKREMCRSRYPSKLFLLKGLADASILFDLVDDGQWVDGRYAYLRKCRWSLLGRRTHTTEPSTNLMTYSWVKCA